MNQETSTQLPAAARHFSVLLSSTPRGARLARILAISWLRDWRLSPGVIDTAEHLVAELAANAATHGRLPGRDFRLALDATTDVLRVEVTDTRGDDLPRYATPPPLAESGRGLVLVEAFADRWGVSLGPVPRKTVWAELDLLPQPRPPAPPEHGGPCSGAASSLL
ncbi:ATP-binding protein [Streptomyces sp. NPDC048416]|uniref:ATP-binding protein n=1 Tax=Streptomyces sp. NPDC048416 TaxID=3365546 RepID=UPI0037187092